MQKKNKNPAEELPKAEGQTQIQHTLHNLLNQIAELKELIHEDQKQSLKNMQNSITSAFKIQTVDILNQLKQEQESRTDEVYTEEQQFDAGKQAMEYAEKSVEEAMKSAMESVKQTEKYILNDIG
jgi:hypothetical protein